jgi:DNA-binding transcriptional MerR regulator
MDKLYSINELATITGLTTRTLRNYIKNGHSQRRKNRRYLAV